MVFCKKCKQEVSDDEYNFYNYRCKKCQKEYMKNYHIKNKEKYNILSKQYIQEHREENKIKCKEYYNIHKKEAAAYYKKHYSQTKDIRLAYCKKWRIQNIDKCRKIDARKRNLGYHPINNRYNWFDCHHLHLENNHDFVIFIPRWLHLFIYHRPKSWNGMDTINAVALDFWINEEFYYYLYELNR